MSLILHKQIISLYPKKIELEDDDKKSTLKLCKYFTFKMLSSSIKSF